MLDLPQERAKVCVFLRLPEAPRSENTYQKVDIKNRPVAPKVMSLVKSSMPSGVDSSVNTSSSDLPSFWEITFTRL